MMASYLDARLHSRLAYVCKEIEGPTLFDTLVALVCASERGRGERAVK